MVDGDPEDRWDVNKLLWYINEIRVVELSIFYYY